MENTTVVTAVQGTLYTTLESSTIAHGDEEDFSPIQQFKTAAYCTIGLCGVAGNLLACAAFWSLQSSINRVSLLIFTQALADLTTSVLLILFGVTQIWRHRTPTSPWLCRFWWTQFVLFFLTAVSTFNLTLISLERYAAVVHPLKYARWFTRRNAKLFVVLVWLLAPVMQYAHPTFWMTAAGESCKEVAPLSRFVQALIGVLLYLWEFVMPVCVMSFCYVSIVRTIRRQDRACRTPLQAGTGTARPTKMSARNKDITITLLILFILYFVCWAPNQTTFVQFNLGGPLDYAGGWYHFTVLLAFLNCCVNPFVYAFRLRQFRERVLLILRCQWALMKNERQNTTGASVPSQQVVSGVAIKIEVIRLETDTSLPSRLFSRLHVGKKNKTI